MDNERTKLIADLKELQLDYNFANYTDKQLRIIRDKERESRFRLCCEINDLAIKLNQVKGHEIEYLFHHGGTKEELKRLKEQALAILEKKDIRHHISYLIEELKLNPEEVISLTIKRKPETIEDYKKIRDILSRRLEAQKFQKDKPNYDESYALGDDPILSRIEYEIIIPKEKVKKMINILDNLRRKGSSSYVRCLSKDFYSRITKKFRNLDENYKLLDSLDFEALINLFNKATEGLEIEPIEEIKYRHYR